MNDTRFLVIAVGGAFVGGAFVVGAFFGAWLLAERAGEMSRLAKPLDAVEVIEPATPEPEGKR